MSALQVCPMPAAANQRSYYMDLDINVTLQCTHFNLEDT